MLTYSGQISAPASTGSQAYTGWGFTPKAVIFSCTNQSTANSISTTCYYMTGFSTTGKQVALSMASLDNVSHDADAGGSHSNAHCVHMANYGGTTVLAAALTSFDSDGITLNWTTTSSGIKINVLAIGGTGVDSVYIKEITSPGSTGSVGYTGFGFQPDHLMCIGSNYTSAPAANSSTIGYTSFGVCDTSLNQITANGQTRSGPTNYSILYDGSLFQACSSSDGSISQRMTVTALDSDGFTANWNTSASSGAYLWVLGIKGGSSAVGKKAVATATGSSSITGQSFEPKGVIFFSAGLASGTSFTLSNNHMIGLCGSTVSNANVAVTTNGGLKNSSDYRSYNTNKIIRFNTASSLTKEAALSSYNSDGLTLNYTTADSSTYDLGYILLGGEESGGGGGSGSNGSMMLLGVGS